MEEKIELINEIFDVDLSADDLDGEVETTLPWDSFHILRYLSKAEEQFHKRITIEQILEVRYVNDLWRIIEDT